jgi:pimeloyl-ACP methyl ester carboxylesterase
MSGTDPWNMRSNLELYSEGQISTSLQATKQALLAAGATATDQVHLVGHSQGGMIAGHLGMGDEFNVRSVITAGSPIEPVLGDQVLSVQLRHSDDPVSALAGGGSPAGTGSPQSFVAEREGDAAVGPGDLLLPMHHLDTYIETARMVDLAGDGRAASLHQLWKQLGTARSVTATEYSAVIPTAQLLAPGDVNNAV